MDSDRNSDRLGSVAAAVTTSGSGGWGSGRWREDGESALEVVSGALRRFM